MGNKASRERGVDIVDVDRRESEVRKLLKADMVQMNDGCKVHI